MLTERDVQLANEVVKDLRARGDQQHALAVQNVLSAASTMLALTGRSDEVLSITEAARALGIRPATVKTWVASGKLSATRQGSRTILSRHALVSCLDLLGEAQQGTTARQPADPERAAAERAFVVDAIPGEVQSRLRTLIEKTEDGVRLTAEEEDELDRLEDQAARINAERLRQWTRQRTQASHCR